MPRLVLAVGMALVLLVALLCAVGFVHAVRRETRYGPRAAPLDALDSGDLLFFNARAPISSVIDTFGRLLSKGALGSAYCHVSAVYRDVRGLFGRPDALYSFEYCTAKGGPVLFPLRARAARSLGRLLCRELAKPRPEVDRAALDTFVVESTEKTRNGASTSSHLGWAKTTLQRHVLFLCPDPRTGGTCADHVLRFLEAAGLWRACDECFCTSVTDLLQGKSEEAGLPSLAEPELVKRIKGTRPPSHCPPAPPPRGGLAASGR